MTASGLTTEVSRGRGQKAEVVLIDVSGPFEVLGRIRDTEGKGWSKLLRWQDADGRTHEYSVSDAALHGEPGASAAELALRGLMVWREARTHLIDYLLEVDVDDRVTTVNRTGWHTVAGQRVFVFPNQAFGSPEAETVILSGAATAPYESRGTLRDWRESVGRLSCGHRRLVLALSTAFAGPLLGIVGAEGGGINLYGTSSRGKTTALKAAASVYGRGAADPGFMRSWRATANAQEATAAIVTDTLLCLDEIGVAESRDAAMAVYQLATGVGKGRAARDGSMRTPLSWRVLTLSTGEIPMSTKIADGGRGRAFAGQSVRLLDIPADAGQGYGVFDSTGSFATAAELAEALQKATLTSYGTAGPAFVKVLVSKTEAEIVALVNEIIEQFLADHLPPSADGQVRRAAKRLALIAAAGELATAAGIVPWDDREAEAAAACALMDWIATRGGSEPGETREAILQVRRFLEAYGDARFDALDDADARKATNRVGWRRGTGSERVWFVTPEQWRLEVCAGLDAPVVARVLADRGMLKRDCQNKLQRSERTPNGTVRVYVITAAIFEGDEDAL